MWWWEDDVVTELSTSEVHVLESILYYVTWSYSLFRDFQNKPTSLVFLRIKEIKKNA